MWNWEYAASVDTTVEPERIWSVWKDVEGWPRWDRALKWARLDGPFQKGTRGELKPEGFPVSEFLMTRVEPMKGYSDLTQLPLTTIEFDHRVEQIAENKYRLTHHVKTRGMLALVLRFTLRRQLKKGLRKAIEELVRLAENE